MMEKSKKIAGITCDDYKIEKFKESLISGGFTDFEVKPFKPEAKLSLIQVTCFESDYPAIGKICEGVENHFKAMKN